MHVPERKAKIYRAAAFGRQTWIPRNTPVHAQALPARIAIHKYISHHLLLTSTLVSRNSPKSPSSPRSRSQSTSTRNLHRALPDGGVLCLLLPPTHDPCQRPHHIPSLVFPPLKSPSQPHSSSCPAWQQCQRLVFRTRERRTRSAMLRLHRMCVYNLTIL